MEVGTIVKWYKKEGDRLEKDEPLVEILGEKVTYDLESPASGVLRKILAAEGTDIPINSVIALVGDPDEEIAIEKYAAKTEVEKPREMMPQPLETSRELEERVRASPLARRIAEELCIDLKDVQGSGPGGRITERDVREFAEKRMVKIRESIPLSGMRKTVAERMSLSAKSVPRITLMMEVDASEIQKLQQSKPSSQVSLTDILVKGCAMALETNPMLNSRLEGDWIRIFEDVNVGVAVATPQGLVVPVVHNANKKTLSEVSATLQTLIEKARDGSISKEEMSRGTFTITNLGMYGVDSFTPLVNPPECAILGVGKLAEKPTIEGGKIVSKPKITLSLSFDHRIVDGVPAAQFLGCLKDMLERPQLEERLR